ncbi:lysophospholipid acyltransferase family protein [Yoonia sp. R2331]|uniref:lysophospholipid acyltransferase family protein n=1 Tax=Yoonia sp. R2331 TaxID=3237238 RepID=UPI0034E512AE
MRTERRMARDISYSHSAETRPGRLMIRAMEAATGRGRLIRKARGYGQEVAQGADFWDVITTRYGIGLDVARGSLDNIPRTGPVIVVANHPYGILDGLMLGRIMSERRDADFRVLAHKVFRDAPDLEKVILPVNFDDTKDAIATNIATRKAALCYLEQGGAIGVFPGGTVSTAARPFAPPMDPVWRNFTAKMIQKSDAMVVPLYFDGSTSRLFQVASHLHTTLRMGLLIREFKTRIGTDVRICIGEPIPAATLRRAHPNPKDCMDFLRKATYDLSPGPVVSTTLGHEFEARYKGKTHGSRHI